MGIIDTLTESQFIDRFNQSETYKHNFSDEALTALFDYLEELSEDLAESIDFDLVAICCDWAEYTLEELKGEFNYISECEDNIEFLESMEEACVLLTVEHDNADDTYLISGV